MTKLEIFQPGRHTDISGQTFNFSEEELGACVRAYDPAVHEAPFVVGHPSTSAPAYAWVDTLSFADGKLLAEPKQVDPEFAELVNNGRFKKISASFYLPDSPHNPKPGSLYLRHVGVLGAQPPAVKGLKDASFGEAEEGVVSFGEVADIADLLAGLREFLISEFGLEKADTALPKWGVEWLRDRAREKDQADATTTGTAHYSEAQVDELQQKEAALKAREAALEARELAAKKAEAVAFAESLVKEGRLAPAHVGAVTATMLALGDGTASFSEGGAAEPLLPKFREFLKGLPAQVSFGEATHAGPAELPTGTADFAAPAGYTVDPDKARVHSAALDWQRSHPGADYKAAVRAVERSLA